MEKVGNTRFEQQDFIEHMKRIGASWILLFIRFCAVLERTNSTDHGHAHTIIYTRVIIGCVRPGILQRRADIFWSTGKLS